MCGRYRFTAEGAVELQMMAARSEIQPHTATGETDEIRPSALAPVLLPGREGLRTESMIWGFPHFRGSGLIINARCETVMEKRMFRESALTRRCVIPSTGFYEWSRSNVDKTRYLFRLPGETVLHMAGIWNTFRDEHGREQRRFVILTTEANDSMLEDIATLSLFPDESKRKLIHDRMPVILMQREIGAWLSDDTGFTKLLSRAHIKLQKQMK